ncbi:SWI/SNF complex subunit SMARCC2 [Sarcoptes scabiei]|uniref:SWI/SNF complex subunit SMARCC2 n=1 Tax=Sarcoptes scabiei TaxID=52283 RepID=A0A834VCA1_SARSC|nr:SWI/SNF complex subunit SMARCC2 [Sarcoptes scabiei]
MANIQFKKRDNGPNLKFFECSETIQLFDSIRQWIQKNCKKFTQIDPPTNKSLANLAVQLIQYQEELAERNILKPPLLRLPAKYFLDFKAGGKLCRIFEFVFKFKSEQGWRRLDFQSPSRSERNSEMFSSLIKYLQTQTNLVEPHIYILPEVDKTLASKLKEIVKKFHGKNVETIQEATHVIYPPVNNSESDEFVRLLIKRDRNILVHCVQRPDSYDCWINVDVDLEPEPEYEHEGPYELTANWLLEMEEFEEWMNEEDYEIEIDRNGKRLPKRAKYLLEELLSEDKKDRRNASFNKGKRRRSPSPQTDKKRRGKASSARSPAPVIANSSSKKKLFKNEEDSEDLTKDMDNPSPETHFQVVNLQNRNSINNRNKDNENMPIKGGTLMDLDSNSEFENENHRIINSNNQVSTEPGKVSRSESPNRFSNTNGGTLNNFDKDDGQDDNVTEQANHIIIPSYASWFDYNCIHAVERRALPEFFNGRNKSKTPEVYIAYRNFMIDTYRLNPTEYLTLTAVRRNIAGDVCAIMRVHAFLEQWGLINYQVDIDARPTPMGPPSTSHFHVLVDTPSGLQPLNPPRSQMSSASQQIINLPKENGIASKKESETNGFSDNFGLKLDQYARKNSYFKSKAAANLSREWTEQETLLLLEALELYKDDWNKVCEHIGSRTQDECILHFLRLPIEDPYLDDTNFALGPLSYHPIPFSKSGNPIMSTVAFLASVVDPRIAASAAKAAMDEFAKLKEEVPASLLEQHSKNVDGTQQTNAENEKGQTTNTLATTNETPENVKKQSDDDSKILKSESAEKSNEKNDASSNKSELSNNQIEQENVEDSSSASKSEPMEVDKSDLTDSTSSSSKENDASGAVSTSDKSKESDKESSDTASTAAEDASKSKNSSNEAENTQKKKDDVELSEKEKNIIKESQISVAAAAALGSAAVKARHLAAIEERKIKSLVALLVETQMKKLEIKLRHFEELEAIMDREKETLEYQRQQLMQDRQQFHLEQMKAMENRARSQAQQIFYQQQQIHNQSQPPSTVGSATQPQVPDRSQQQHQNVNESNTVSTPIPSSTHLNPPITTQNMQPNPQSHSSQIVQQSQQQPINSTNPVSQPNLQQVPMSYTVPTPSKIEFNCFHHFDIFFSFLQILPIKFSPLNLISICLLATILLKSLQCRH